jgi:signal transduction histidine kinase
MQIDFSAGELDLLFPAYIKTDRRGVILSCGSSYSRHLPKSLRGTLLLEEFKATRPAGAESIEQLRNANGTIILEHRKLAGLKLRGVLFARRGAHYLLVGHVPNVAAAEQSVKYRYADFSPCDGSQDVFLAAQMRKGLLEDAHALAEQLRHEKIAAEAANIAKSSFLACMSHEIRTPLNGILGMADVLSKTSMTDNQAEMLQVISDFGKSLLQILNDILDLARIDSGRFEIAHADFDMVDLTRGIETVYRLKCNEKNVRFALTVDPAMERRLYQGDVLRIRQVLNNLVSNAVKFTESGSVTVAISESAEKSASGLALNFKVKDTGIGIDAVTLNRLFSPFVQADASITRRFGGTGLGLSISKRLCELMGGKVCVESVAGEGSTFAFSIPVSTEAALFSSAIA